MAKECMICHKPAVVAARLTQGKETVNIYLCESCVHSVAQNARVEVVESLIPNMPKGYVEGGENDTSILDNAFDEEPKINNVPVAPSRVQPPNAAVQGKPKKKKRHPVLVVFLVVLALMIILPVVNGNSTSSNNSTSSSTSDNTADSSTGSSKSTISTSGATSGNVSESTSNNATSSKQNTETSIVKETESQKSEDEKMQEFKASCVTLDYKEVLRYPEQYTGNAVVIEGKVVQVIEGLLTNALRVSEIGASDNVWYVTYKSSDVSGRILEDDEITVWGLCKGTHTYSSLFGQQITIPSLSTSYISLSVAGSSASVEVLEDKAPVLYNTLSGSGANVMSGIEITEPTMITLSYSGNRFISVKGYYGSGEYDYDSFFGAIGPFNGTVYVSPGKTYDISVDVNDAWTMYFETMGTTTETSFNGTGSTVTSWFAPSSNKYQITYDGSGFFSVKLHYGIGEWDYNSLVGEIGTYDGIVRVDSGGKNCFLEISGDGNWSITPVD